jgi:hypothetical protein
VNAIEECPCGIARVDCDYHAPPPERELDRVVKYLFKQHILINGQFIWEHMHPWEIPLRGKFLTADNHIHTFVDGKIVSDEDADA